MSKKFDEFKFKWYGLLFKFYGKLQDRVIAKMRKAIGTSDFPKWFNKSMKLGKKRDKLLGKRQEILRKQLQRVRDL